MEKLGHLHKNVTVFRHPNTTMGGVIYWSHHEKVVVIDQRTAFIGGIDLCLGRFDNNTHLLFDNRHESKAESSIINRNRKLSILNDSMRNNAENTTQEVCKHPKDKLGLKPTEKISSQINNTKLGEMIYKQKAMGIQDKSLQGYGDPTSDVLELQIVSQSENVYEKYNIGIKPCKESVKASDDRYIENNVTISQPLYNKRGILFPENEGKVPVNNDQDGKQDNNSSQRHFANHVSQNISENRNLNINSAEISCNKRDKTDMKSGSYSCRDKFTNPEIVYDIEDKRKDQKAKRAMRNSENSRTEDHRGILHNKSVLRDEEQNLVLKSRSGRPLNTKNTTASINKMNKDDSLRQLSESMKTFFREHKGKDSAERETSRDKLAAGYAEAKTRRNESANYKGIEQKAEKSISEGLVDKMIEGKGSSPKYLSYSQNLQVVAKKAGIQRKTPETQVQEVSAQESERLASQQNGSELKNNSKKDGEGRYNLENFCNKHNVGNTNLNALGNEKFKGKNPHEIQKVSTEKEKTELRSTMQGAGTKEEEKHQIGNRCAISEISKDQKQKLDLLWPGKDYYNPLKKDFVNVENGDVTLIDRNKVPRMPWHDLQCKLVGGSASDVANHFIERWNMVCASENLHDRKIIPTCFYQFSKDVLDTMYFENGSEELSSKKSTNSLEVPRDQKKQSLSNDSTIYNLGPNGSPVSNTSAIICSTGGIRTQIVRSVCQWSQNTQIDNSIEKAYNALINESKKYIYMENQFFITNSLKNSGEAPINNIGYSILTRIAKAHANKEEFKVYILIPLMPAFESNFTASPSYTIRKIISLQSQSICKGKKSLFECLKKRNINPDDYIVFLSLKTFWFDGQSVFHEQIYVHSKLLIVDGERAIVGSANLNDRSMVGHRDSEIATVIDDSKGKSVLSLLKKLLSEHLGIGNKNKRDNTMYSKLTESFKSNAWSKLETASMFGLIKNVAKLNSDIYKELFRCIPDNDVKTVQEYYSFKSKEGLAENAFSTSTIRALVNKIQGRLVLYPYEFLINEDDSADIFTIQGLIPSSIFY